MYECEYAVTPVQLFWTMYTSDCIQAVLTWIPAFWRGFKFPESNSLPYGGAA